MSPIDSARIVDPELERRAGVVAAIVTLAEKIPIEQADRMVTIPSRHKTCMVSVRRDRLG